MPRPGSIVTGCSLALIATASLRLGCKSPVAPTTETQPSGDVSPPGDETPPAAGEPGSDPLDVSPGGESSADGYVEASKQQLAKQLGVDASSITVALDEDIQWNNGALGCPQPDMAYTQAVEPGYRVVLEHNGTQYSFHGRHAGEPCLCESPQM